MVALPNKHTAARLTDVETDMDDVKTQTDRGRRQRKLIWIVIAAVVVGQALQYALIAYLLMGRSDSRRYYNERDQVFSNQLKMVICAIPPGNPSGDVLREQAKCPPSRGPSGSAPGAPASSPAPTRTITGEANLAPRPGPSTTERRPSTRTVTRAAPARPDRTRTTPRAAAPVPASPTATPTQGLLPGLLCSLLGCVRSP